MFKLSEISIWPNIIFPIFIFGFSILPYFYILDHYIVGSFSEKSLVPYSWKTLSLLGSLIALATLMVTFFIMPWWSLFIVLFAGRVLSSIAALILGQKTAAIWGLYFIIPIILIFLDILFPKIYQNLNSDFLQLLVKNKYSNIYLLLMALVVIRIILAIYRILKGNASFFQREPQTRIGGIFIEAFAFICVHLARFPLPVSMRIRMLLPSITLYSYKKFNSASPNVRLKILKQCEKAIKGIDAKDLPAGNLVFLVYWYMSECIDMIARLENKNLNEFAEQISSCYKMAAFYAKEENLELLCISLSEFYRLVKIRFIADEPKDISIIDTTKGIGAIKSVLWATNILRIHIIEGPKAVKKFTKLLPLDLPIISILSWTIGPAKSWPSPLLINDDIKKDSHINSAIRKLEIYYQKGEILQGISGCYNFIKRYGSFPDIHAKRGSKVAYLATSLIGKVMAEYLRIMLTIPLSQKNREKELKDCREFINMIGRLIAKHSSANRFDFVEYGYIAILYSVAADLCSIAGWHTEAFKYMDIVEELAKIPSPGVIEAKAIVERIRGDVYAGFGAIARSTIALKESSTWFAILGEWTRWIEAVALYSKANLSMFEQRKASTEVAMSAVETLIDLGTGAKTSIGRKGYTDLYNSWALWGEYLISTRSKNVIAIKQTLNRAERTATESRFNAFDIIIMRILLIFIRKRRNLSVIFSTKGYFLKGYFNIFLRARRQIHTIVVMSNLKYWKRLIDYSTIRSSIILRKARKFITKQELYLPESINLQIKAEISLTECVIFSKHKSYVVKNAIEQSIGAILELGKESMNTPTDILRRSACVQRVDILNQLIKSLSLGQSILQTKLFNNLVKSAYFALQGLRAEGWNNLINQKFIGAKSANISEIRRLQIIQNKLASIQDRLFQNGVHQQQELFDELKEFSEEIPEIVEEDYKIGIKSAIRRIRNQLEELLKRHLEITCDQVGVIKKSAYDIEMLNIPKGAAIVEYFKTDEEACAFVITGEDLKIRFFKLFTVKLPNLNRMVSSLHKAKTSFEEKLLLFNADLQNLAKAYWPDELTQHLNRCDNLYIIPWDDLWMLPFSALPIKNGTPLIINKYINILPSIDLIEKVSSDTLTIQQNKISVITYDPEYKTTKMLSSMRDEIVFLRNFVNKQNIFENEDATPETFLSLLETTNWLHVACHGETDQDTPMFSRLLLAKGDTSNDGSLYLYQINGEYKKLYGVFLNSCDSNLGYALGDRPETIAAGFIAIGANIVICTLGKIFDKVAYEVSRTFYNNLKLYPPNIAFTLSIRQIYQLKPEITVHEKSKLPVSHPAAWWPFIIISRVYC